MATLNASVQRARESRGESDEHATVHEMKPRKKAAAKKTVKKAPAKKGAAKKTTMKKTAGRKPRSAQDLPGVVITWREKRGGRDRGRAGNFQSTATPPEEVRPMNAVSMWVLPLPVTAGD
ncbi:hypothetical protein ACFYWN_43820 [Streptomyces sp. NPDC002917]|uniref:hypothetical protein n=2 Tax=Streptomyces TaxID=1883 RepID=UPI0033B3D9E4|nr:hypothetical protein OH719_05090 [Streptomyces sp. NBC_01653]WTD93517.1 hypothetical protein OG891_41770 [Streptomyces sp. NBC_01637]WTF25686.1 hypothetical protein OG955_05270 [Streptomyces sp. NBC_01602]